MRLFAPQFVIQRGNLSGSAIQKLDFRLSFVVNQLLGLHGYQCNALFICADIKGDKLNPRHPDRTISILAGVAFQRKNTHQTTRIIGSMNGSVNRKM